MTSEQNVSEVQPHQDSTASPAQQDGDAQFTGQNVPHGMGQSKSSRRRRRKRKNKGSDAPQAAQPNGDQGAEQPIGSIQASGTQPQAFQPQGSQGLQAGGGQQQNSGAGGKRWKKKFRDRDRQRPQENPGNQASGSNGGSFRGSDTHQPGNNSFKRKGGGCRGQQQSRPRRLLAPMDPSSRAVNGNFPNTPP